MLYSRVDSKEAKSNSKNQLYNLKKKSGLILDLEESHNFG